MQPDLMALIGRWNGIPRTLAHVRDGANAVYRFSVDSRCAYLRLSSDAHRSRDLLEAELDFIDFLASRGVRVAMPLASVRGATVESAVAANGDQWHAIAFDAAPGRHFRYFSSDIDRPLFRAWAAAMGTLHAASRDFVPVGTRRRPVWSEQDTTCCDRAGVAEPPPEALREQDRVVEWMSTLRPTAPAWGLIHGDFERTNFTIEGGRPYVYDFDDACYHWYMADMANALWAFRNAPADDRARFLAWFLEGYRERNPIEVDARVHVSWFVRLRSLSLFFRSLREKRERRGTEWESRMRASFSEAFRW